MTTTEREGTASAAPSGAAGAIRWSSLSVLARQGFQVVFAVLLARLIGPESYGAVGAATVIVTLSALLLDQGLAAALVQRAELPPRAPGAAASVNLLAAGVLGAVVLLAAPGAGAFFSSAVLPGMLAWLAPGLLLKGAAIAPRAMLLRRLALADVAKAEIAGTAAGAVIGATAALAGAGPAAFVVATLVTDALLAAVLLGAARGPVPNLDVRAFRPLAAFGGRVFATNLVAYASRNTDNVLVGRFLGPGALAHYSMAYRVLVIPVQLLGQSLNRVLFPMLSRLQDDREGLALQMRRSTALLAMLTVPPMVLIACAAAPLVRLVLGPPWAEAAPVMAVLALAGARETVFYSTPILMRASGRAGLGLRFQLAVTVVQLAGIVAGLPFGILGVAIGYAAAGVLVTPALLVVQRRLTGTSVRRQLRALAPSAHVALWGAAAYGAVAWLLHPASAAVLLAAGSAGYLVVAGAVLLLVHPAEARRTGRALATLAGRGAR